MTMHSITVNNDCPRTFDVLEYGTNGKPLITYTKQSDIEDGFINRSDPQRRVDEIDLLCKPCPKYQGCGAKEALIETLKAIDLKNANRKSLNITR